MDAPWDWCVKSICLYSNDPYFIASHAEHSNMSGSIGTSLLTVLNGRLRVSPFLPSTASSLCCKEELEGPSMYL